jgi:hypothetical protein
MERIAQMRIRHFASTLRAGGALLACGTLLLTGCGGEDATIPAPLQSALAQTQGATTFTFNGTTTSGAATVKLTGEYSVPNDVHESVQIGTATLEFVRVNGKVYRRDSATAAWAAATTGIQTDPRTAFALLGDSAASGSGNAYTFTLSGDAAAKLVSGSTAVTGTATVGNGYITGLTYSSVSPAVKVQLTYTNFNATAKVTPPPGVS